jgi:hypothetical protein
MADIRINSLSTTASASSSDDFIALDGTTNGTRKLSAYSPTFNLTVNGTASAATLTDGYITVSAAQINRGAGQPVELQYAGAGGVRMFGNTATPITFSSAGNLTVSGGTVTGGTSGMSLASGGTNQNIALTPSGTGIVSINRGLAASATGTAFVVQTTDASSLSLFAELEGNATSASRYVTLNSYMGGGGGGRNLVINRYGGNLLLGTTTDGGQKLQVAGTAEIQSTLTVKGAEAGPTTGISSIIQNTTSANDRVAALRLVNASNQWNLRAVGSGDTFSIGPGLSGSETNYFTLSSTGNATLAGNLTVSGTGTSSFAGPVSLSTSGATLLTLQRSGSSGGLEVYADATGPILYPTDSTDALRLNTGGNTSIYVTASGNVLLGTTTDSGNGKLQLATHTTSAGGIGFGTDTPIYRSSAGVLRIDGPANSAIELNGTAAGIKAITMFESGTIAGQVAVISGLLLLRTGSSPTTALTLDSSQNATFVSNVILNGATASPTLSIRGANANASPIIYLTSGFGGGSQQQWSIYTNDASAGGFLIRDNTAGSNLLTIAKSTGDATFAGTVRVNGQLNAANGTTYRWDTSGDVYARQVISGANGTDGVKLTQTGTGTGIVASVGDGGLSFRDNSNLQLLNLADATGNATFLGSIGTQGGVASTPASASATGVAGTILWDASYIYVCTATNTWKRAAIATW